MWIIDRHFLKSQLFDLSTDEPIYDRNCSTTKKTPKNSECGHSQCIHIHLLSPYNKTLQIPVPLENRNRLCGKNCR